MHVPLLEFDPADDPYVDPRAHRGKAELPERGVLCFFDDVVADVTAGRSPAYRLRWEHGHHDVFTVLHGDVPVAVCHPGCGAPLAAANLDVLIAMGCTKVLVCGSAGTLAPGFGVGHPIVVVDALRDEGTSYHYLPADDGGVVASSPAATAALVAELEAEGVPFETGRTWTTDGLFRETRAKVARRREEGCLTVEMEASALLAVAAFRGATVGQLLYCADDLSAEEWDHRDWDRQGDVRRRLFDLCLAAVTRL